MEHHGSGFVASPWAAVLGHHSMASDAGFAAAAAAAHVQNVAAAHHTHPMHGHPHSHPHSHPHHHHSHPHPHTHSHHHHHHLAAAAAAGGGMPMDLHVPQGFPYYRYREDALCWGDRKSMEEIGAAQSSVNARILELRKEKSRDAARSRRGKENYEFYELAKMLPLPAAITSQLDKASIIRLTISYLKLRDFSGHGDPPWTREASSSSKLKSAAIRRSPAVDLFEQHQGTHILQSLDGFALAVAADGRFLYISETVSIYLGLSQVEMTGSSIFDYIHQADHAEIADQLGLSLTSGGAGGGGSVGAGGGGGSGAAGLASPTSGASDDGSGTHGTNNPDVAASMTQASTSGYKGYDRSFCVRMKSTLTKRGCHFKSSGYRASDATSNCSGSNTNGKNVKNPASNYSVVLLLCKLRPQYTFSHTRKAQPPLLGMVALAIALPPPSVHEIRLECDMFVTRVNFDLRVAHCEPRVSDLLDYTPEDLVNKSLYCLCHAEDANRLRKSHTDLIEKGQVLTGYYRLMNKNGGYTWLQTCATVVCSTKNADEQNIICVNYVISNRENENLILDCCQLEPSVDSIKHEEGLGNDKSSGSPGGDASGEGNAHLSGDMKLGLGSPKTDAEGHTQRGRGRNAAHGSNLNSSLALIKDSPTPLGVEVDGVLPVTVSATPTPTPTPTSSAPSSKRKRKSKAAQQAEEQQGEQQQQQPLSKLPALEQQREPRSRLPSMVEDVQPAASADSAVKDLEHAMSKHLPSPSNNNNNNNQPSTDFSTDALIKQQQQQQQAQQQLHVSDANEKSSTIQWIGTPYQQPAPMPATALLRQLYANRESVIRATARQTPTGVGVPGVFYGEQQGGPLPTPPGSESSYENQYLQLHSAAAAASVPHPVGQKSGNSADAFTNLVSTYGGYHSSIDYHNAMTPPSSVSPRDSNNSAKLPSAAAPPGLLVGSNAGYDYADPLRGQYATPVDGSAGATLPLKPQAYTAGMHPHATTTTEGGVTYSNLDQPQYFAPHSSFHLYHKGSPASAWYSTPS
ncbi:protein trachealess isoform X3 [Drosophila navojoa]|uniref:protein trachealess isoform X3 n=1 Tax=Drosophila navojoa TaxID=7232 RepID=UPI0011BDCE0D|nr:protein trachealess isoform X3 [Drosophila navojoa]